MKSIRVHQFGGPEVLQLEEVPDPTPGEGQVVVRLMAIGVNPVETYIRAGRYGPRQFPFTPGSDGGGVVERVGAAVKSVKTGDRVYVHGTLSGAYAERALCSAGQVHPLPDELSFEQGAAVGVPYVTAHFALFERAQLTKQDVALIHGASGGVGLAAVQMAAPLATVIGTAGTPEGRGLVAEQGAQHVIDHTDPDHLQHAMKLTGGRGVDVFIEMAAHTNLGRDLPILARHGRVVVVGSRGPVEITPRDLMGANADIRGMTILNISESQLSQIHESIGKGLRDKTLRPIVSRRFPLAQAPQAHEAVLAPGAMGKIVLTT